ncbi:hypothetical protein [Nocardia farcinica]|uniref:hypothetical protein n=1 Tax=Nocardia farcinica TaxID=37329 RepID=UPI003CC80C90
MTQSSGDPIQVSHLIGGQWRPASDGATFESRDPHDDSLLAVVAPGTPDAGPAAHTPAPPPLHQGPGLV